MSKSWDGIMDSGSLSDDSYRGNMHIEPIFQAFLCPLTKQVMKDPVTIENGQTFEREAIENWFGDCIDRGRRPTCPLTQKELKSTDINPSIALRNAIEEWIKRNEVAQLEKACRTLASESPEIEILQMLSCITQICENGRSNKHVGYIAELIPMIIDMLKSGNRKMRVQALETLCAIAKESDANKEAVAAGETIRIIVKILSHEHSEETKEAMSLLYELSKSRSLCGKIGGVSGAILLLVGMASTKSESTITVEKTLKTLQNLDQCEENVRQMAENGRLQPLLTRLLQGSLVIQLTMASYLGDLVLSNDVKVFVAETAGSTLVDLMKSESKPAKEAALKAFYQISSNETSAKILIQAGILPPLVKDLFAVGINQLPTRLKEVSATVLSNLVSSGIDFGSILLDQDHHTLISEDIVHNLLHLISNTGPAIECKLLQVLIGLTSSSTTIKNIVAAIKSSGATISLIQFLEAPQREVQIASIKLLGNVSPHMGAELTNALRGTAGQLGCLISIIAENHGITEEQADAVGLLANLLEDYYLTKQLLDEGAFKVIVSNVVSIRQGVTRGGRFVNPFLEGLVRVLSRFTYILDDNPDAIALAREHNLATLFADLLQTNGLDNVQVASTLALRNLSKQSQHLTRMPVVLEPRSCFPIFSCCLSKQPVVSGLCRVHHGSCSVKDSFCLLEGRAVEQLVACLDHANVKVVEAALAALCTLLDDEVDIEQGVTVLDEAEGIKPILEILRENHTEILRQQAVWAVERILRKEVIAYEISGDPNIVTALVEVFRRGDSRTRQIAERALKHIDKLPNFSAMSTEKEG